MRKYYLLLSPFLLGLWSTASISNEYDISDLDVPTVNALSASRMSGKDIAARLAQNYNNIVADCGAGKPAYLCSGITLRGTSPALDRFALDPSPSSVKSGGVSFSYLRKDTAFWRLAYHYQNGYILYNKQALPDEVTYNLQNLCYFPEDGGTDVRSDAGCGATPDFPDISGPCQAQGVTTAEQWIAHFNIAPAGSNKWHHQCGFDIRETGQYDSAASFYQGLLTRNILHKGGLVEQNEIRIASWDTKEPGYPEKFPVQAFFYIYTGEDSAKITGSVVKGIDGARYDQFLFYQRTKIWVPVIRITLPQNKPEEAKFQFIESEQRVPVHLNLAPIMYLLQ
ncbi:hypothetical protein [Erwinia typographi]|uniref:hypothetical protein n=1 Tax=Erwinia typographi TaxID=371042 RepID=UPI0006911451|nr:hypothetical protein [Erwinia typographi]